MFGLYGNTLIFYESTSDRIGVVYHDRSDNLAAKYSTDGGSTWSARNVGRYGTIPVFTGILVGSKVLVELCDYGANYYLYQMKYDIGTNTWSTATQITNFGKIYYPRALFKDVEGRLHLAFSRYTTKYRDVYYMYSDDEGSTWRDVNGNILSLPISIDSTARVYTGADIQAMDVSADGTGKIYILCKEGRIYFYNGASWTMKTTSITVDTKSGPAKSLIFHKGKLHAIFQVWDGVNNPTKDYVYAYSCDDGDSWSHPPKITWDTIYDEAEIMNNIVYNDKWYGIFIHGFTKSYGQDIHFLSVTC